MDTRRINFAALTAYALTAQASMLNAFGHYKGEEMTGASQFRLSRRIGGRSFPSDNEELNQVTVPGRLALGFYLLSFRAVGTPFGQSLCHRRHNC
jgi:hypothetical protein